MAGFRMAIVSLQFSNGAILSTTLPEIANLQSSVAYPQVARFRRGLQIRNFLGIANLQSSPKSKRQSVAGESQAEFSPLTGGFLIANCVEDECPM